MSNRITYILASALLIIMIGMALFSMKEDTLTFDETAHIGAGYSYLSQRDMRMNPEHPPLIKDLSAVPLMFLNLNFPGEHSSWVQNEPIQWWTQFDFATQFIYNSGNNPDIILFASRIPMLLVLLLLGFFIFRWTKETFGNNAGLMALFLFSFSPTFLAHGRLVTTDVGAATAIFIATYYFIKFLKENTKKNLIKSGIVLGLAFLVKFSTILIIPLFGILVLLWSILTFGDKKDRQKNDNKITDITKVKINGFKEFIITFLRYTGYSVLIGLIALFVIWVAYSFHTLGYPPEKQLENTKTTIEKPDNDALYKTTIWMSDKPILRPMAQYMLGLIMVFERSDGGNTTYFMGEISADAWKSYFPVVYFVKAPLPFHIFTLLTLISLLYIFKKLLWQKPILKSISNWAKLHIVEIASLIFIAIYWAVSLSSNLNIGVRHLLPVFPFTMLLVGGHTAVWITTAGFSKLKKAVLAWLLLWQAYSVISIYPHFLAYFNEFVGGPNKGYLYAVDSNLDWGQDLKRLSNWMNENNVNKIYIDYFGGGNLDYYLGDRYEGWSGQRSPEEIKRGSYIAVSVTQLQGGRGIAKSDYTNPTDYYNWLDNYDLVEKIGYSIFIYYID
ncbi:MAG: glycosyltransferase family 39 protein [Candidatus Nealsonbacteria bacterium]